MFHKLIECLRTRFPSSYMLAIDILQHSYPTRVRTDTARDYYKHTSVHHIHFHTHARTLEARQKHIDEYVRATLDLTAEDCLALADVVRAACDRTQGPTCPFMCTRNRCTMPWPRAKKKSRQTRRALKLRTILSHSVAQPLTQRSQTESLLTLNHTHAYSAFGSPR